MTCWKPVIDWNATYRNQTENRSEARIGIGVGILQIHPNVEGDTAGDRVTSAPKIVPVLPIAQPGDIHGAF